MNFFNLSRFYRYITFDFKYNRRSYIESLLVTVAIYFALLGLFYFWDDTSSRVLASTQEQAFIVGLVIAGICFMSSHFSNFLSTEEHRPDVSAFEVWLWGAIISIVIFPILYSIICVGLTVPLAYFDDTVLFIPFVNIDAWHNVSGTSSLIAYLYYLIACSLVITYRFILPKTINIHIVMLAIGFYATLIAISMITNAKIFSFYYFLKEIHTQFNYSLLATLFVIFFWIVLPLLLWISSFLALNNYHQKRDNRFTKKLATLSQLGFYSCIVVSLFVDSKLSKIEHSFPIQEWSPITDTRGINSLRITQWEDIYPAISLDFRFTDEEAIRIKLSPNKKFDIQATTVTRKDNQLLLHLGEQVFTKKSFDQGQTVGLDIYLPRRDWKIEAPQTHSNTYITNNKTPISLDISASHIKLEGGYNTISVWQRNESLRVENVSIQTLNLYAERPTLEVEVGINRKDIIESNEKITEFLGSSKSHITNINLYGDEILPIRASSEKIIEPRAISQKLNQYPLSEKDRKKLPPPHKTYYW